MGLSLAESTTFNVLEQTLGHLSVLVEQIINYLNQYRSVSIPQNVLEAAQTLTTSFNQVRKQVNTLEEERRSLKALAQIGYVVNSSLELDEVLQIVMDTLIRLTKAERGFLMLKNDQGELIIRVARDWEKESIDRNEFAISRTIVYRVVNEGEPILTTNAQEDPRFTGQQSVVAYNLRSILCVPMKVKGDLIGVVYADNRIRSGLFNQKELDLLTAFANQAAVAIENARLFASVKQTLAEVTGLKNLMDNVFSSIASGVLTADVSERILMCNRAAEQILGKASLEIVGSQLGDILEPIKFMLNPHLDNVLKNNQQITGLEASPKFPSRGRLDLLFSLSPLKDVQAHTQGVAIVLEDLTEKKHLEAQRSLLERIVSPAVLQHIDPNSIKLGGIRVEVTSLFADIRGFTSFSEGMEPESLVAVLNKYLAVAADALLQEEGTIDKFLGDGVMAWFNAPISQSDHTLRAVRAALEIRNSLSRLHAELPPSLRLSFGVGIHVGDAVLGMIGTEKRLDYTAIGDSINTAKRIQENAGPGQVFISQKAYKFVSEQVDAVQVEPITAKGKREPIAVFNIIGLR
jgi:adenylate cyclase